MELETLCYKCVILFTGALISSATLTGHTNSYWTTEKNTTNQCIDWGVECDPTGQQLMCCRYDNLEITNIQRKTVCADGWKDGGLGTCSVSRCINCTSPRTCLSDAVCLDACLNTNCYPGVCYGATCNCSYGFSGSQCQNIDDSNNFFLGNVNITLLNRNLGNNKVVSMVTNTATTWWTNKNNFNRIILSFDAALISKIPNKPPYILTNTLGVKSTGYSVEYTEKDSYWHNSYSWSNMTVNQVHYRSDELQFTLHIDHNESFRAVINAEFGGRKLVRPPRYIEYRTIVKNKSVWIGFDFVPPTHCSRQSCSQQPLFITQEVTPKPVHLQWKGWQDINSGIKQYVIDVYKLLADDNGNLRQPSNTVISIIKSPNVTDTTYTPTDPGVYSFIIRVEDNAGNKEFCRRFAIYDPASTITKQIGYKQDMRATTAYHNTRYVWQATKSFVNVTWKDHFINIVQSKGHFLSRIIPDPFHRSAFSIQPDYDDMEGTRSLNETPNRNGIIKFETVGKIHGKENDPVPEDWVVVNNLEQFRLFNLNSEPDDGDTYQVWVRAHDIMDHSAVDNITIHFDGSAPTLEDVEPQWNVKSAVHLFASRVTLQASDETSGIYRVQWTIMTEGSHHVLSTGYISGNSTSKSICDADQHSCRCDSTLESSCFFFFHMFEIDHCQIQVNRTLLKDTSLTLRVQALNPAMLSNSVDIKIGKAANLLGVSRYPEPVNIRDTTTSIGSTRLEWDYKSSCYNKTKIQISYGKTSSSSRTNIVLPPTSQSLDIADLSQSTDYVAEFIVVYGNESSSMFRYSFTTKSPKVPGGMVAGLVIVCLVAFGLLAGAIFLFIRNRRTGNPLMSPVRLGALEKLDPGPEPRYTSRPSRISKKQDKRTIIEKELNLQQAMTTYEDATMDDPENKNVYDDLNEDKVIKDDPVKSETAVLESLIREGSFTNVYLGQCDIGLGKTTQVAFKCPSPDHSEDREITEFEKYCKGVLRYVEQHKLKDNNLLHYYGVIHEKDIPKLVMEYCAEGALCYWLREISHSFTESDTGVLENIVRGIAHGMEFLAVKRIFHGSLTSFNVLLDLNCIPKLKGFGGSYNSENKIKWTAPECIFSISTSSSQEADVWSFGVVVWEVFSLGEEPYDDVSDDDLPGRLHEGLTLERPTLCSNQFNAVLTTCLLLDQKMRPKFTDIVSAIRKVEAVPETSRTVGESRDSQDGQAVSASGGNTSPSAEVSQMNGIEAALYSNDVMEVVVEDENIYDN